MQIEKKAKKILKKPICDHCLGRQFAQLLTGISNRARGRIIRNVMAMAYETKKDLDIDKSNLHDTKIRNETFEKKKCSVCDDFFQDLDKWVKKIKNKMENIGFSTFLVGTKLNNKLLQNEEKLWEMVGINWCEPIKAEINREVGKIIEKSTNKTVNLKKPQVNFILNIPKDKVNLEINPLFIYGEYQKLKRGIPQTKWPSGKYKTSVEEIIARPFMKASKATGHVFHGMGREDIDAKCLGHRPFVLELKIPKKRKLKIKKLSEKIDEKKVKVRNWKFSSKNEVVRIKSEQPDKTYKAIVKSEKNLKKKDLKKLKELENETIEQQTPKRVSHRRSDKIRKREVKKIKTKYINPKKFELIVKGEAGLYIKELISSDDQRTNPSVSQKLNSQCECKQLDVIKINNKQKKKH